MIKHKKIKMIQCQLPTQQKGVALFATIALLVCFSIILTSSMGSSSVNGKIASLTQQSRITFLAAESAIATAVNNSSLMNQTVIAGVGATSSYNNLPEISNSITQVKLEYVSDNFVPENYSIGTGFSAINFKAVGRSAVKYNPERIQVNTQGFYRVIPSS